MDIQTIWGKKFCKTVEKGRKQKSNLFAKRSKFLTPQ